MVTKSIFKQRKYKVNNNKLTKKKAKKTYKHTGGQNATNLTPSANKSEESLNDNGMGNDNGTGNGNSMGNDSGMGNGNGTRNGNDNPELNTENKNSIQNPTDGLYNKPKKQQPDTELSKAIRKERGGLFINYPGEINGDKEKAIAAKLNLTDTREPGFTSYRGEMDDKIKPKFKINKFYPNYLSYYKLSENTQNTPSNNMGNTESNMEGNMEGNMEANNTNTNTKTESSA